VTEKKASSKRQAVVFPKNQKILTQMGENIQLASKRRRLTQMLIAERTGLSRLTIRRIERGDLRVSMGHYVAVLGVLGLAEDLGTIAGDDVLGRKLQDIELLG
jgi:transcriptional regulator with XRE-family HTH domain